VLRSDDGVEHGLDIRRRPADHAQNLARRGLLLQDRSLRVGLSECLVLLLQPVNSRTFSMAMTAWSAKV
jgi:hypothetical protein